MKRIAGMIQPGVLNQTFTVYEDGNKIETIQVPMKDVAASIIQLAENHNITNVSLFGIKQWSEQVKREIQKQEITKYNKTKLNIICI